MLVQKSSDLAAGDRPRRALLRERRDELGFERLIVVERHFFVAGEVEQHRQRELRRAAAAVTPLKARRRMVVQLLARLGIE